MHKWHLFHFVLAATCAALGARAADSGPARDPFWPVGYQHHDPVAVVATPQVVASIPIARPQPEPAKPDPLVIEKLAAELQAKIRAKIQVSGFLKSGGQQFATVNGQVVSVGEKLLVSVDDQTYHFKVTAISPASVKLEPLN